MASHFPSIPRAFGHAPQTHRCTYTSRVSTPNFHPFHLTTSAAVFKRYGGGGEGPPPPRQPWVQFPPEAKALPLTGLFFLATSGHLLSFFTFPFANSILFKVGRVHLQAPTIHHGYRHPADKETIY